MTLIRRICTDNRNNPYYRGSEEYIIDFETWRWGDFESQEAHERDFLNFESRIPREGA